METDGFLTLHPSLQNSKINNTNLYKRIIETENVLIPQKIVYKWPENEKGEKKELIVKYIPESQQFVGVTYLVEEFYNYLNRLKLIIVITMLIAGLLITFVNNTFVEHVFENKRTSYFFYNQIVSRRIGRN
jgi:hypothetical protein